MSTKIQQLLNEKSALEAQMAAEGAFCRQTLTFFAHLSICLKKKIKA
jgi:hypothetical protein